MKLTLEYEACIGGQTMWTDVAVVDGSRMTGEGWLVQIEPTYLGSFPGGVERVVEG